MRRLMWVVQHYLNLDPVHWMTPRSGEMEIEVDDSDANAECRFQTRGRDLVNLEAVPNQHAKMGYENFMYKNKLESKA